MMGRGDAQEETIDGRNFSYPTDRLRSSRFKIYKDGNGATKGKHQAESGEHDD